MKKYLLDVSVVENTMLTADCCLLKMTADRPLPPMRPGQFVEVRVDRSPHVLLRRPISINYVDRARNELWLLIRLVGEGTRTLAAVRPGDSLNLLLPLGNGFTMPSHTGARCLLIGGGVGTAPLLYLGEALAEAGCHPEFLLGARSAADFTQLDHFVRYGTVHLTTEDGTAGTPGFVTAHPVLLGQPFDCIYTCGPKPMMVAIARYAAAAAITCEASLENTMACGIGACLCCVEKTVRGNVCICTEGPVFDIKELTWQY